jgi:hypothetical protein
MNTLPPASTGGWRLKAGLQALGKFLARHASVSTARIRETSQVYCTLAELSCTFGGQQIVR